MTDMHQTIDIISKLHHGIVLSESKPVKDAHFIEDCPSYTIPGTDWLIQGFSVAGERTGFIINSMDLMFDGGMNTYKTVQNMLITHCHGDHSAKIPFVVMSGKKVKATIYCPRSTCKKLSLFNRACLSLNYNVELIQKDEITYVGVKPYTFVPIEFIRKSKVCKLYLSIIRCTHTVPSIGFIVSVEKHHLKDEYKGIAGRQLGELRKQGIELTEATFEKKFAFMGDTTVDVFKDPKNSELLKTPVIMVECTAIDDSIPVKTARERGHTHWDELAPIVKAHPEITFILIHFSRSYKEDFIVDVFEKVGCSNVVVWLPNKVVTFTFKSST